MEGSDREAILAEIREAFAGVTREGGVSWSEAEGMDRGTWGPGEPRIDDPDGDWIEVADDPSWRIDLGFAMFSFLDPIGYRYYLPAAMSVVVRGGDGECVQFTLTLFDTYYKDSVLEHWSLLDNRQRLCVRHFIEYMIKERDALGDDLESESWTQALDSYWKHFRESPIRAPWISN
jgi:hypothetical protein